MTVCFEGGVGRLVLAINVAQGLLNVELKSVTISTLSATQNVIARVDCNPFMHPGHT